MPKSNTTITAASTLLDYACSEQMTRQQRPSLIKGAWKQAVKQKASRGKQQGKTALKRAASQAKYATKRAVKQTIKRWIYRSFAKEATVSG